MHGRGPPGGRRARRTLKPAKPQQLPEQSKRALQLNALRKVGGRVRPRPRPPPASEIPSSSDGLKQSAHDCHGCHSHRLAGSRHVRAVRVSVVRRGLRPRAHPRLCRWDPGLLLHPRPRDRVPGRCRALDVAGQFAWLLCRGYASVCRGERACTDEADQVPRGTPSMPRSLKPLKLHSPTSISAPPPLPHLPSPGSHCRHQLPFFAVASACRLS